MSTPRVAAWLLVAHGSRTPELAEAHAEMCDRIGRLAPDVTVRPAYLELTDPPIPDAIAQAVADGADLVVLVPYFLHVGNHTGRDLPAIVEAARARHAGVTIVLAGHLGIDDRLAEIAADRARQAITDHGGLP